MSLSQDDNEDISPRVSVLMTVYNAGEFLKPAIDSILAQTFRDFELIIVENGSTDYSRSNINSYSDPRINILQFDHNIGRTPALIKAFECSKGEYIAILDADDVSLPNRLEIQVNYLNTNPEIVLLGSRCKFIDERDQVIGTYEPPCNSEDAYQSLPIKNIIAHSSALYRRKAAIDVGGYPAYLTFAQDFGLWIGLAKIGKITNLPNELVLLREHSNRVTNLPESTKAQYQENIICLHKASQLPKMLKSTIQIYWLIAARYSARLALLHYSQGRFLEGIEWTVKAITSGATGGLKKLRSKIGNLEKFS